MLTIKPFTDKEDAVRVMLTLLEYKDGQYATGLITDTHDGEKNSFFPQDLKDFCEEGV